MTESIRISALLEKTEERLQLLALLSSESSPFEQQGSKSSSGATASAADGEDASNGSVAHILEEQKRLEARYEQLLLLRGNKKANNKRIITANDKV